MFITPLCTQVPGRFGALPVRLLLGTLPQRWPLGKAPVWSARPGCEEICPGGASPVPAAHRSGVVGAPLNPASRAGSHGVPGSCCLLETAGQSWPTLPLSLLHLVAPLMHSFTPAGWPRGQFAAATKADATLLGAEPCPLGFTRTEHMGRNLVNGILVSNIPKCFPLCQDGDHQEGRTFRPVFS